MNRTRKGRLLLQPNTSYELKDGDELGFGEILVRVVIQGAPSDLIDSSPSSADTETDDELHMLAAGMDHLTGSPEATVTNGRPPARSSIIVEDTPEVNRKATAQPSAPISLRTLDDSHIVPESQVPGEMQVDESLENLIVEDSEELPVGNEQQQTANNDPTINIDSGSEYDSEEDLLRNTDDSSLSNLRSTEPPTTNKSPVASNDNAEQVLIDDSSTNSIPNAPPIQETSTIHIQRLAEDSATSKPACDSFEDEEDQFWSSIPTQMLDSPSKPKSTGKDVTGESENKPDASVKESMDANVHPTNDGEEEALFTQESQDNTQVDLATVMQHLSREEMPSQPTDCSSSGLSQASTQPAEHSLTSRRVSHDSPSYSDASTQPIERNLSSGLSTKLSSSSSASTTLGLSQKSKSTNTSTEKMSTPEETEVELASEDTDATQIPDIPVEIDKDEEQDVRTEVVEIVSKRDAYICGERSPKVETNEEEEFRDPRDMKHSAVVTDVPTASEPEDGDVSLPETQIFALPTQRISGRFSKKKAIPKATEIANASKDDDLPLDTQIFAIPETKKAEGTRREVDLSETQVLFDIPKSSEPGNEELEGEGESETDLDSTQVFSIPAKKSVRLKKIEEDVTATQVCEALQVPQARKSTRRMNVEDSSATQIFHPPAEEKTSRLRATRKKGAALKEATADSTQVITGLPKPEQVDPVPEKALLDDTQEFEVPKGKKSARKRDMEEDSSATQVFHPPVAATTLRQRAGRTKCAAPEETSIESTQMCETPEPAKPEQVDPVPEEGLLDGTQVFEVPQARKSARKRNVDEDSSATQVFHPPAEEVTSRQRSARRKGAASKESSTDNTQVFEKPEKVERAPKEAIPDDTQVLEVSQARKSARQRNVQEDPSATQVFHAPAEDGTSGQRISKKKSSAAKDSTVDSTQVFQTPNSPRPKQVQPATEEAVLESTQLFDLPRKSGRNMKTTPDDSAETQEFSPPKRRGRGRPKLSSKLTEDAKDQSSVKENETELEPPQFCNVSIAEDGKIDQTTESKTTSTSSRTGDDEEDLMVESSAVTEDDLDEFSNDGSPSCTPVVSRSGKKPPAKRGSKSNIYTSTPATTRENESSKKPGQKWTSGRKPSPVKQDAKSLRRKAATAVKTDGEDRGSASGDSTEGGENDRSKGASAHTGGCKKPASGGKGQDVSRVEVETVRSKRIKKQLQQSEFVYEDLSARPGKRSRGTSDASSTEEKPPTRGRGRKKAADADSSQPAEEKLTVRGRPKKTEGPTEIRVTSPEGSEKSIDHGEDDSNAGKGRRGVRGKTSHSKTSVDTERPTQTKNTEPAKKAGGRRRKNTPVEIEEASTLDETDTSLSQCSLVCEPVAPLVSKLKRKSPRASKVMDEPDSVDSTPKKKTRTQQEPALVASTPVKETRGKKEPTAKPAAPNRTPIKRSAGKEKAVDLTAELMSGSDDNEFETPSKRARKANSREIKITSRSPLRAKPSPPAVRVLYTGIVDSNGEKIIKELGGKVATSVAECTHLVTDKFRRTCKFLSAVSRGVPIVTPIWLQKCNEAKQFIDTKTYLLKDATAEKHFKFSLAKSIEKASKQPMLSGYSVHVTPKVQPEPMQMKEIIESAGGQFLQKLPSGRTSSTNKTIIVSTPEENAPKKGAAKKSSPTVVSSEFILTGILRQEVDLKSFLL